jgi:hypothetical protein
MLPKRLSPPDAADTITSPLAAKMPTLVVT